MWNAFILAYIPFLFTTSTAPPPPLHLHRTQPSLGVHVRARLQDGERVRGRRARRPRQCAPY